MFREKNRITALGNDVTTYNSYTAANQLASMGPSGGPYTTFTYDSLHRLSQKVLPNSTKTTPTYDSLSELMSLTHQTSGGQALLSTSYTYDVLGNRLTRTDSPSLTPPPVTTDASTWSYDVANRLLNRPGVTYTYDNNGNTLTKSDATGTTTYGYDYENRLTSVSAPGGITASYAYDPFGRRISKTVNGVMTQYLYDGMNLIKEYDGTGTLLATYTQGPGMDQPIAMTRGGQTYDYHADGLGSITGLTNSSQVVVQNYGYDGFGNLDQTPTIQNPYTYTGREWDAETGLYYYRARYYDSKIGRFITQDPIGFMGGDLNLYAYVTNNPMLYTDPSGLLFGIPAGESYGDSAAQYWADQLEQTGNPLYYVPGALASLWTPCTSNETALTLAGGYVVRVLGPFSPRGVPRPLARLRKYIRFDRPHYGRGWEFDGDIPRWIRNTFSAVAANSGDGGSCGCK